jgi:hypothetical protein
MPVRIQINATNNIKSRIKWMLLRGKIMAPNLFFGGVYKKNDDALGLSTVCQNAKIKSAFNPAAFGNQNDVRAV